MASPLFEPVPDPRSKRLPGWFGPFFAEKSINWIWLFARASKAWILVWFLGRLFNTGRLSNLNQIFNRLTERQFAFLPGRPRMLAAAEFHHFLWQMRGRPRSRWKWFHPLKLLLQSVRISWFTFVPNSRSNENLTRCGKKADLGVTLPLTSTITLQFCRKYYVFWFKYIIYQLPVSDFHSAENNFSEGWVCL